MHYIYYLNFVSQICRVLRPRQVSRFPRPLEMRMFAKYCSGNVLVLIISQDSFQAYLDFVVASNWTKVALIYDDYTHDTLRIQVIIIFKVVKPKVPLFVCYSFHVFHFLCPKRRGTLLPNYLFV